MKTEESFRTRKADITIKIIEDNFLCLIENKIKSGESEDQTKRYAKLSKQKYPRFKYLYIFLTPTGGEANSEEFISFSYKDLKDLLKRTLKAKKDNINEEVEFLIKQFILNLEVNILNEGEIQKLCQEIYKHHKRAIDKIISHMPDYINTITEELKKLLDDEWGIYPTKKICLIFKKKWLEDFKEFFSPNYPLIHYEIRSWEDDGLYISVEFHIEEDRKKGGKFNLRDKINKIFDTEFNKYKTESFPYKKGKKLVKFKKIIIENGYEDEEELKDVALFMEKLINETIDIIEKSIKTFLENYKEDLNIWKSQV